MNKEISLVIMAAGMGSRFGGLKQIEPMGPAGEFIIDYSVYDAIKAGFTKIIFIIKKENYSIFKETIGKRVEDKIKVEYVFQELNNLPEGYTIPASREKPLGTAQAILCCKDVVNTPFAIINADDFYGKDAYIKAAEYLQKVDNNSVDYGLIAYHVKNTITDNGSVKRGICKIKDGYLTDLIESKVERKNNVITATPLNGTPSFEIEENQTVSMNMLLFSPTIFKFIEDNFKHFLEDNKNKIETAEYLIPDLLQKLLRNKEVTAKVIETTATWYGVTYKEDKEIVKQALLELTENKTYKRNLWS